MDGHLKDLEDEAHEAGKEYELAKKLKDEAFELLNQQVLELTQHVREEKARYKIALDEKKLSYERARDTYDHARIAAGENDDSRLGSLPLHLRQPGNFRSSFSGRRSDASDLINGLETATGGSAASAGPRRSSTGKPTKSSGLSSLSHPHLEGMDAVEALAHDFARDFAKKSQALEEAKRKAAAKADSPSKLVATEPTTVPGYSTTVRKYLQECPVICRTPDNKWVELRCMVCKGNYYGGNGWIKGARGMAAHITRSHKIMTWGGQKLDSDVALRICKQRDISDEQVEAILADEDEIEKIPVQETVMGPDAHAGSTIRPTNGATNGTNGNSAVEATKGGFKAVNNIYAKMEFQDIGNQPVHEVEDDDVDLPGDMLRTFPCIIYLADDRWAELRCKICGGNTVPTGTKHFATGVNGFKAHLGKAHHVTPGYKTSTPETIEFVLKHCHHRDLTQAEVDLITDEDPRADIPPRLYFNTKKVSGIPTYGDETEPTTEGVPPTGTQSAPASVSPKKKAPFKKRRTLGDSDESDREYRGPKAVSGAANVSKRPRDSVSEAPSPKLRAKKSRPSGFYGEDRSKTPPKKDAGDLQAYCPCTLSGHECQDPDCKKTVLCIETKHNDECRHSSKSHDVKTSCLTSVDGHECKGCRRGHDQIELRREIYNLHNCNAH